MGDVKKNSVLSNIIIGVVLIVALRYAVKIYDYETFNKNLQGGSTVDRALRMAADSLNKTCPIQLDSITKFDSASTLPNQIFIYHYTLKIDTTKIDITKLKEEERKYLLNAAKTNKGLNGFRKMNVELNYNYNDEKGNALFGIKIFSYEYK